MSSKKENTKPVDASDIIFDDDADMPAPETKDYEQLLMLTPKFIELFYQAIGEMPYVTILKNKQNNAIKITDLAKFIDLKSDKGLTLTELQTVIGFLSNAPFKFVRPLMEIIDNKERQSELWQLKS